MYRLSEIVCHEKNESLIKQLYFLNVILALIFFIVRVVVFVDLKRFPQISKK